MLVLTRKPEQSIVIAGNIEIVILEVRGEQVRVGIRAPKEIAVHRKELLEGPSSPIPNEKGASKPALLPGILKPVSAVSG